MLASLKGRKEMVVALLSGNMKPNVNLQSNVCDIYVG